MGINDWPPAQRPREKLLALGAEALSDAELLAIFLRTGVRGCSAVDLAQQLLDDFGSLNALMSASLAHFSRGQGLGEAKYCQLQAVLEMARRYTLERLPEGEAMTSAQATREYLALQLRGERREVFAALFLDSQHRLIAYETLFYGGLDSAAVYPREVLMRALSLNAAAVIFAHNHPSGVAEPSAADRQITETLRDALALVDIRVLDHCVVAGASVVSMAERGML